MVTFVLNADAEGKPDISGIAFPFPFFWKEIQKRHDACITSSALNVLTGGDQDYTTNLLKDTVFTVSITPLCCTFNSIFTKDLRNFILQ